MYKYRALYYNSSNLFTVLYRFKYRSRRSYSGMILVTTTRMLVVRLVDLYIHSRFVGGFHVASAAGLKILCLILLLCDMSYYYVVNVFRTLSFCLRKNSAMYSILFVVEFQDNNLDIRLHPSEYS